MTVLVVDPRDGLLWAGDVNRLSVVTHQDGSRTLAADYSPTAHWSAWAPIQASDRSGRLDARVVAVPR